MLSDIYNNHENSMSVKTNTALVSDTTSSSSDNSNPDKTKEGHIYKNRGFYAFRYVAMLLSGAGFLTCLISVLSITISKLVNGDNFSASSWYGPFYANLVSAVVVLGITHLLLSLTVGKNWKPADEENRRYPVVLSVIYSIGLGISIMYFLVFFIGTLIDAMLGLSDVTGTKILEQFLISFLAILILGFALIYKLDLISNISRIFYVIVMGSIALITTVLFLIFPTGEIKNTLHDENTARDLNVIEDKIGEYNDENGILPQNLNEITFKNDELKYKISDYEYKVSTNSLSRYERSLSSRSYKYEICAIFKTNTEDNEKYYYSSYKYTNDDSFYYHPEGRKCFTRTIIGGYEAKDYEDYYEYENESEGGSNDYDRVRQFSDEQGLL